MQRNNDSGFWNKEPQGRDRGDNENEEFSPLVGDELEYLNPTRRALLEKLKVSEDWVTATNNVGAPWTFVCCERAGWIEKRRKGSETEYRITVEGLAALLD